MARPLLFIVMLMLSTSVGACSSHKEFTNPQYTPYSQVLGLKNSTLPACTWHKTNLDQMSTSASTPSTAQNSALPDCRWYKCDGQEVDETQAAAKIMNLNSSAFRYLDRQGNPIEVRSQPTSNASTGNNAKQSSLAGQNNAEMERHAPPEFYAPSTLAQDGQLSTMTRGALINHPVADGRPK